MNGSKETLTRSPFFMAVPGDLLIYGTYIRGLYRGGLYKHLYMGPLICNPIEDNNTLWNYSFLLAAAMLFIL